MTALDELITRYEETTSSTAPASRAELAELRQRAEAAETQRDTAWSELREIRRLIEADKDESTLDEVTRKVYRSSKDAHDAEQERDESRRKLREAQTAIDAMAQIVGAADEVKHQLEQARSDIEDYRAEIARLNQAATA